MSFIDEQAGGVATTGTKRIMELAPTDLHQRCPVILGSKNEVERIIADHREAQQTPRVAATGQVAAKCGGGRGGAPALFRNRCGHAGQGGFEPQAQAAPDYEFDQRIAW